MLKQHTEALFLEGTRLYLRPIEPSDTSAMTRWVENPEVSRYLGAIAPPHVSLTREWVGAQLHDRRNTNFVFAIVEKNADAHIGNISIYKVDWLNRVGTFGVIIGEKNLWGHGYATEAGKLLLKFAFENLNLRKINASVIAHNKPAVNLHEKNLGFKCEGRLTKQYIVDNKYLDVILFSLFFADWQNAQSAQ